MTYSIITENLQAVHFSSLFIVLWHYYLLKDTSPLIVCCAAFIYISLILLPIVHVRGFKAASNDLSSWWLQLQCLQNSWFWGCYNYSDMDFSLCWWWWCKLVLVTEQRVFLWTTKRRFRFKSFLGCLSRKLLTFWWCMIKRKEGDDATLPNTESIHTFMYIRWSLLLWVEEKR